MNEAELTCRELVELVNDYLFDALAAPDRERFVAHVATCKACTIFIEQMRTTIALTGRLREEALDEHMTHELLRTFRAWKAAR